MVSCTGRREQKQKVGRCEKLSVQTGGEEGSERVEGKKFTRLFTGMKSCVSVCSRKEVNNKDQSWVLSLHAGGTNLHIRNIKVTLREKNTKTESQKDLEAPGVPAINLIYTSNRAGKCFLGNFSPLLVT